MENCYQGDRGDHLHYQGHGSQHRGDCHGSDGPFYVVPAADTALFLVVILVALSAMDAIVLNEVTALPPTPAPVLTLLPQLHDNITETESDTF